MLQGDLYDHESLVKVIKQVDVVISTVGHAQLPDQLKIIAAIKEAGNVKVNCPDFSLSFLSFFVDPSTMILIYLLLAFASFVVNINV